MLLVPSHGTYTHKYGRSQMPRYFFAESDAILIDETRQIAFASIRQEGACGTWSGLTGSGTIVEEEVRP